MGTEDVPPARAPGPPPPAPEGPLAVVAVPLEPARPSSLLNPRRWILAPLVLLFVIHPSILGTVLMTGLEVIPLIVLAVLLHAGVGRPGLRVLAVGWLALLLAGLAAMTCFVTLSGPEGTAGVGGASAQARAILLSIGALGAAGLGYLPTVRRGLAQRYQFDPQSSVHAAAATLLIGVTLLMFVPLLVLGDPPILRLMGEADAELPFEPAEDLLTFCWTGVLALVAVGWPRRRGLHAATDRLGFVRTSLRLTVCMAGVGLLMVPAFHVLDWAIQAACRGLGVGVTDMAAFERLLAQYLSLPGALVIAVTAGVGEELLFRGALQPRVGIPLSNTCFASLHAWQYGWDGVASVFLAGLVLAAIRARWNTTASAVVHGTYDFVLVLIAAAGR